MSGDDTAAPLGSVEDDSRIKTLHVVAEVIPQPLPKWGVPQLARPRARQRAHTLHCTTTSEECTERRHFWTLRGESRPIGMRWGLGDRQILRASKGEIAPQLLPAFHWHDVG